MSRLNSKLSEYDFNLLPEFEKNQISAVAKRYFKEHLLEGWSIGVSTKKVSDKMGINENIVRKIGRENDFLSFLSDIKYFKTNPASFANYKARNSTKNQ